MDKNEMLKKFDKLKHGSNQNILAFANKYLKDKKYQKDIRNAAEQMYTFGNDDKSGDIYYLLRDIKSFIESRE